MIIEINNTRYQVDEGANYVMNYNEELDSATVRISHLLQELDIEPFDKVKLITDAFTRYMCIDTWSSVQEGVETPTYVYNITLVSQTKLLENIVLPNISITPRKIGNKLSIADYLKQYLREYASHTEYYYDSRIDTKFADDCPELQWNRPTLREVLTTLMMVKDCIPILENNRISWLDLTNKGSEVNKTYINYITKRQSSDEYVSELRMDMQNVMQTNVKDVKNVCTTFEELTFTTNSYVATTENIYLKTKFPILNIKHLWLSCYYYSTTDEVLKFKVDLCNIDGDGYGVVYEGKEYNILPVLYRTSNIDLNETFNNNTVKDYFSKWRNYCVYYNRGSNEIIGFTDIQKGVILSFTNQTYEWIKALAFSRAVKGQPYIYNSINNGYKPITGEALNGFFNAYFSIEYETTVNSTFSARKDVMPKNERVVIDHQSNSWVEAYNQGFLEYQKANRLGNQRLLINQRSEYPAYYETMMQIGQTYNDTIIYRVEYQFYKHHVEVNAHATKNYILQNYFTSIKSRVRTWVNARDEAFIRSELVKRRCEFSFENNYDSNIDYSFYLSSLFVHGQPIKYAIVKTSATNNNKYILDCVGRLIGNSVVFTTGFNDNCIIDKHVNTGEHESGVEAYQDGIVNTVDIKDGEYDVPSEGRFYTYAPSIFGAQALGILNNCVNKAFGGIPFNPYKYVDDDYEYESISIELAYEIGTTLNYKTNVKQVIYETFQKPLLAEHDYYHIHVKEENIQLHKDNKEIPIFNLQYEFGSDNANIVATEYYARYNIGIRTTDVPELNFYYSNKSLFNRNARKITDIRTYQRMNATLTWNNTNGFTVNGTRPENTTLYICDSENNIILMINDDRNTIYMNISNRRF